MWKKYLPHYRFIWFVLLLSKEDAAGVKPYKNLHYSHINAHKFIFQDILGITSKVKTSLLFYVFLHTESLNPWLLRNLRLFLNPWHLWSFKCYPITNAMKFTRNCLNCKQPFPTVKGSAEPNKMAVNITSVFGSVANTKYFFYWLL